MRLSPILIALDESDTAQRALDLALTLAKKYAGELLICTAVDHTAVIAAVTTPDAPYGDVGDLLDEYDRAGNDLLQAAAARATAAGVPSTSLLLDGSAVRAIVDCAKERTVAAIVMGTHGRSGIERMFLGSTAEGVLRLAEVPVFVVRDHDDAAGPVPAQAEPGILVAFDDSDPAAAAAAFAVDLAVAGGAELFCCTVAETETLLDRAGDYGFDPTPMLDDARRHAKDLVATEVARARERGAAVQGLVVEGSPADALIAAVAEHGVGLIAIGTHGRRGLRRLFVGSVAESVVRRSPVPVVVVRGGLPPAAH